MFKCVKVAVFLLDRVSVCGDDGDGGDDRDDGDGDDEVAVVCQDHDDDRGGGGDGDDDEGRVDDEGDDDEKDMDMQGVYVGELVFLAVKKMVDNLQNRCCPRYPYYQLVLKW